MPMKLCVSIVNNGKAEFRDNLLAPSDCPADRGQVRGDTNLAGKGWICSGFETDVLSGDAEG